MKPIVDREAAHRAASLSISVLTYLRIAIETHKVLALKCVNIFKSHIYLHNTEGKTFVLGRMQRQTRSSGTPWEEKNAYSRIVKVGPFVYVSGTTASDESGTIHHSDDPYGQAAYILKKIEAALQTVGAKMAHVVRSTVYLTDIDDFEQVAKAHKECFDAIRPANTLVEVSRLAVPEMRVEIAVDAVIDGTSEGSFNV